MDWALFCQIEVMMLTAGLVISFIISTRQTTKDNSFFKRLKAVVEIAANGFKIEKHLKEIKKDDE